MKKQDNGFSIVEVLILIGIIAILGLLGFVAYNQLSQKPAAVSTVSNQPTTQSSGSTTDAQTTAVRNFVEEFYKAYLASSDKPSVVAQYGSQNFSDTYFPTIKSCMQNTPASVTVNSVDAIKADGVSRYGVSTTYNFSESAGVNVGLTVVKGGGAYELDTVSCSQ